GEVMRIRIGDVNGFVELAFGISPVQNIDTFGGLVIPLAGFWADRVAAEGNCVRLEGCAFREQDQLALFFQDENPVRFGRSGKRVTCKEEARNVNRKRYR